MSTSGSTTGTPVVVGTYSGTPTAYLASAVSLARYAEIIQYSQCAFFGVSHEDNELYACREIWTQAQRDEVAFYLKQAQNKIESIIGYPLVPTWISSEKAPYKSKIMTKKAKLLQMGARAEETIAASAAVSHATDPATVTIATTLTSTEGIGIFYPENENIEIIPYSMEITGGNLIVSIPRCRLVKYDLRSNPVSGLLYTDISNFQTTVLIKRFYTDASTQASLVWPHGCTQDCSSRECADYSENACQIILNHDIGAIQVYPATYSGGTWTKKTKVCCGGYPEYASLNYKAGLTALPNEAETAIIRLAHALMPETPCGCEQVNRVWMRDSRVPDVLTRERLNCPFGLSNGAWEAWLAASDLTVMRGSVL